MTETRAPLRLALILAMFTAAPSLVSAHFQEGIACAGEVCRVCPATAEVLRDTTGDAPYDCAAHGVS